MTDLWFRFIQGLDEIGVSSEAVSHFKYCGGDTGSHLNYWRLCFGREELPENTTVCICGHKIVKNCYITGTIGDEEMIIIVGSCCIKRFIPKYRRTCEKCEREHRNTKNNLCKNCRPRPSKRKHKTI